MRKSKLHKALDALRKPDARLIQTNNPSHPEYCITGVGRIETKTAQQIISHPQIIGAKDALFPGLDQTWRFR